MERSLYPDRVLVGTEALSFTEDSKIQAILQRFQDSANFGVVSGLIVSASTNPTQLAILAGRGYTSSGEEVVLPTSLSGINPASTSTGVANANYVCLIYAEDAARPEAHATLPQTVPTRALSGYRVQVFLLTELEALLATSPNLAVNAQDRVLICGIATAGSTGNFNSNGATIVNAPFADAVTGVVQPVLGATYVGSQRIVGTVIRSVDPATPTTLAEVQAESVHTNGVIVFTPQAPLASIATATLSYQAPGDATAGTAVVLSTTVIPVADYAIPTPVTLTSSGGRTLVVDVVVDMLPNDPGGLSVNYTDTLDIIDVYANTAGAGVVVPRAGANDVYHRHLLGTGAPTPTNPHGLRIGDLSQETADFSQGIIVGSGLLATGAQALSPRILIQQSTQGGLAGPQGPRTLLMDVPLTSGLNLRLYATSSNAFEVAVNAIYSNAGTWSKDVDVGTTGASLFSFSERAFAMLTQAPGFIGPWTDTVSPGIGWFQEPLVAEVPPFAGIASVIANVLLNAQQGMVVGASLTQPAPQIQSPTLNGGGNNFKSLLLQNTFTGGGDGTMTRLYQSCASAATTNEDYFEFTSNAVWVPAGGGTPWQKDVPGIRAMKLELGHEHFALFSHLADGAWSDTSWTQVFDVNLGTFTTTFGNLSVSTLTTTSDVTVGGLITVSGDGSIGGNETVGGSTGITLTGGAGTGYRFTTAHPGSVTITPAGRTYQNSGLSNLFAGSPTGGENDGSIHCTQNSGGNFQYQITLPHGATLVTGQARIGSQSGTQTGNINFYSISKTTSVRTPIGSTTYSVAVSTSTVFSAPLSATVDNTNNIYQAELAPTGTMSGWQLYWFEIDYTVTQLSVF